MSVHIHNTEPKTYLIFGAPHSATSFVARALSKLGVEIHNDLGHYYQNRNLMKLNMKILNGAGGKWCYPPKEEKILRSAKTLDIKGMLDKYKGEKWGFKDPRTSLTAKAYFPHLDGDVYLVCTFRKTDKIVESYKGKDDRVTKELVDKYNRSIISAIKEFVGLEIR